MLCLASIYNQPRGDAQQHDTPPLQLSSSCLRFSIINSTCGKSSKSQPRRGDPDSPVTCTLTAYSVLCVHSFLRQKQKTTWSSKLNFYLVRVYDDVKLYQVRRRDDTSTGIPNRFPDDQRSATPRRPVCVFRGLDASISSQRGTRSLRIALSRWTGPHSSRQPVS